jgi:hypothetical protein
MRHSAPMKVIDSVFSCTTNIALGSYWTHDVTKFVDGSVSVACAVKDFNDEFQVTSTRTYLTGQVGASTWSCGVTADLNNQTNGWINFVRVSDSLVRATVNDGDNTQNGTSLDLASRKPPPLAEVFGKFFGRLAWIENWSIARLQIRGPAPAALPQSQFRDFIASLTKVKK